MTEKDKKKKTEVENENSSTAGGESPAQDEAEMVTIPLKEYAQQMEKIDELQNQVDQFSDGWQRERAEFANYRKRAARDEEFHRQTRHPVDSAEIGKRADERRAGAHHS